MIDKHYRRTALRVYGDCCELCGYRANLEAHHIDYQEHQAIEDRIRKAEREKKDITSLLKEAKEQGYDEYAAGQLSKLDSSRNLAIVCGNCHNLIHKVNMGKLLLNVLKPRV